MTQTTLLGIYRREAFLAIPDSLASSGPPQFLKAALCTSHCAAHLSHARENGFRRDEC